MAVALVDLPKVHSRIVSGSGVKTIWADRTYLRKPRLPYGKQCHLLDEVMVFVDEVSGRIIKIEGQYDYDPARVSYFRDHIDGLMPGLGGHGEFMSQVAAAGVLLANGAQSASFTLTGVDKLRFPRLVRHPTRILALAKPRYGKRGTILGFSCRVFLASQYARSGENARVVSSIVLRGHKLK